jgi:Asp-tRNA(Asn)/Glu-tRNA(Gln) amidotransferase A subunit family amidase
VDDSQLAAENLKLLIWRAFSGIDASMAKGHANTPQNGVFHGITVGIKDIIDVAGLPTRNGSRADKDALPPTHDAACVAQLRAAGAIIVGKTVTTELATFVPAETINPHYPAHTPGGSSCGSAAAVAARHVDLALGTQTAGSVLRPAAYCGVFGFKPTFGLVPRDGVLVQSPTLDTVGVFARDVETLQRWLAIVMNKIADEKATATTSSALRIHVVQNWLAHVSSGMRDALVRATQALRARGHEVVEITLPREIDDMIQHQRTIQNVEAARAYERYRTKERHHVTPALLEQLDAGAAIPESTYQDALRHADAARTIADDLLNQCDAWLMPAAPGAPPLLSEHTTGDPLFNRLASVLGTPAISVPGMRDAAGLPLGLQLVAKRGMDASLLSAASTLFGCLD